MNILNILRKFFSFIDNHFVKPVEESKKPLLFWFLLAYSILFIRNFIEMSIEYPGMKVMGGFPYPYDTFLTIFIEYPLYGLYVFVLPIILSLFLRIDVKKITKLVIVYLFIIWIPPIVDIYIVHKPVLLTYIQDWKTVANIPLYMLFLKHPDPSIGLSRGMRIEVWLGIIFVILYIILRCKIWWKRILFSIITVPLFIFSLTFSGFIPLLFITVFKWLKMLSSDAGITDMLKSGLMGGHEKTILVFMIFGLPILILWTYLADKRALKKIFSKINISLIPFLILPITVWAISYYIFRNYMPVLFKDPFDYFSPFVVLLTVFTFFLAREKTEYRGALIFINFISALMLSFPGLLLVLFLWTWEFFWRWIKKPAFIVRFAHYTSITVVLIFIGVVPFVQYRTFWVYSFKFFIFILLPYISLIMLNFWSWDRKRVLFWILQIYTFLFPFLMFLLFKSYYVFIFEIMTIVVFALRMDMLKNLLLTFSAFFINFVLIFISIREEKLINKFYNEKVAKAVAYLRMGDFYFSRGLNETSGRYFKDAFNTFRDVKTAFKYTITNISFSKIPDSIIEYLEEEAYYKDNPGISLALPEIFSFLGKKKEYKNYLKEKMKSSRFGEIFEYKLAQFYREKGKPDSVYFHARNSLVRGMDPDLALPLVGEYLLYKEKWKKAIDVYLSALDAGAKDSTIYRDIGKCYANLLNYRKAIEWYEKYLTFNKDDSIVTNNVAILYAKLGEYEKAKLIMEELLNKHPAFPELYVNLYYIHLHLGEKREALSVLERGLKAFPHEEKLIEIKKRIQISSI